MAKAKTRSKPAAKKPAARTARKPTRTAARSRPKPVAKPAARPAAKPPAQPAPAAGKRPPMPAGRSWISPYLTVRDCDAAVAFYQKAFGFDRKSTMPGPGGKTVHAEMAWRGCVFMFGAEAVSSNKAPATSQVPCPIALYVYCDDVDAQFARAAGEGATVVFPPKDMFYGDRVCALQDLDGYTWQFATNVADFDPSRMLGM